MARRPTKQLMEHIKNHNISTTALWRIRDEPPSPPAKLKGHDLEYTAKVPADKGELHPENRFLVRDTDGDIHLVVGKAKPIHILTKDEAAALPTLLDQKRSSPPTRSDFFDRDTRLSG